MEAAVALQADPTLAQGPWGGTAQSVAVGLPPVDTPEENPAPTRPAPHTRAILRGTVLDSNQMAPHLPGSVFTVKRKDRSKMIFESTLTKIC